VVEGPVAFQDLPKQCYPFTLELIDETTNEVVWSVQVPEPGAVRVPGKQALGVEGGVASRMTWAEGHVRISSTGDFVEE
jgi:hypothetical protein